MPALDAIAGEPDLAVALVVTNPPKAAGRGDALRPTAVADAARRLGVPLVEVAGVRRGPGAEALAGARPDAIVVVAYGEILTHRDADHGPLRRGEPALLAAASMARRLARSSMRSPPATSSTGVTVMRMDAGLDTGPILAQLEEQIRPEDDAGALGMRLAHIGALLLVGVLRMLPDGGVPPRAQDDRAATVAPTDRARGALRSTGRARPRRSCAGSGRCRLDRGRPRCSAVSR